MKQFVFDSSDIFEKIEGDPDNVIFKIPPEICEELGWREGDVVKVTAEEGKLIIKKNG